MNNLLELRRMLQAKESLPEHVGLVQPEMNGGKVTREQIATIAQHPGATALTISGLDQDSFEFLVKTFGRQFKAIHFWKCPRIADLTPLEDITELAYVAYYWNQRSPRLWNFRKTKHLVGLSFEDFTKLSDLSDLAATDSLVELEFGNAMWNKCVFQSLDPLGNLRNLKQLRLSAKKIEDGRIDALAELTQLTVLDFPTSLFTTDQVAWLRAKLPASIICSSLAPSLSLSNPIASKGKQLDTLVVGYRKPLLDSTQDAVKLSRYREAFAAMLEFYTVNPDAKPGSYKA